MWNALTLKLTEVILKLALLFFSFNTNVIEFSSQKFLTFLLMFINFNVLSEINYLGLESDNNEKDQ